MSSSPILKSQVSLPEIPRIRQKHKDTIQQVSENEPAKVVVLHEPGISQWMGSLHPNGSLYERPVRIDAAMKEHVGFKHFLEETGCTVFTVREILLKDCDKDVVQRVKLEDLAFDSIKYLLDPAQDESELSEQDKVLLSDQYKSDCLAKMDNQQLVDVILTNPTIYLRKALKNTELLVTNYSFLPLVNLVFTRDQQITTAKGIIMGNPTSPIRRAEVRVMKFCFEKLGFPVVGEISSPGTLEGGDFYPWNEDLCLIGTGPRTNMQSIKHMLNEKLFGTRRVGVVKDYFDQDQQRMHLDTIMNILGPNIVMMEETLIGSNSIKRRLVDEYVLDDGDKYILSSIHDIELSEYLHNYANRDANGSYPVSILPVSRDMQFKYGINGLNLGGGHIALVDNDTAKYLARSGYTGKISLIQFRHMMDMYGSIHCCSQVVSRAHPHVHRQISADSQAPITRRFLKRNELEQSSQKAVMLAPNSFLIIPDSENPFLALSVSYGTSISRQYGPREYRQQIIQEYSEFHRILTSVLGLEIYLFTHEEHHSTPEAVFVRDWFSTHPSHGDNGKSKFITYNLRQEHRRGEKRSDIIEIIGELYEEIVDLNEKFDSTKLDSSNEKTLQVGGVVFDRLNSLIYGDSTQNGAYFMSHLANEIGYRLITFNLKNDYKNFTTSGVLSLGTKYAIVCLDAIDEKDHESLRSEFVKSGKTVVEVNLEQLKKFCPQVLEVVTNDGKRVLVVSKTSREGFTESQLKQLESCVDSINQVELSLIEKLTGRSASALVAPLF